VQNKRALGERNECTALAAEAMKITMPALSSTMKEGRVVSWLKSEGDAVEAGEAIMVVESDKADMDVEAFEDGFIAKILVGEGETAPVGDVVALMASEESEIELVSAMAAGGGVAPPAAAVSSGAAAAAPAGDPGSARTSVFPIWPARERESIAVAKRCCPYARIASSTPGMRRSNKGSKASGVTSRGDNPVPPVTSNKSTPCATNSLAAS